MKTKYYHSYYLFYLPWVVLVSFLTFCVFCYVLLNFFGNYPLSNILGLKTILIGFLSVLGANIFWRIEYFNTYYLLDNDALKRHGRLKFWCKEIPYEDIEYIADDELIGPLSILGIYHSKNWKYIELFGKENPDGSKKIIRMIPYNLIGFDEFINELIKRSPNIKMIAPSLKKYLETGKIHRTDNGNMRQLMMGKSYLEMSDEELDKYRESAKK